MLLKEVNRQIKNGWIVPEYDKRRMYSRPSVYFL